MSSVDLTGTWAGNDEATYFLRQIGATVFWVGLRPHDGRSLTNVFHGFFQTNTATEEPADLGTVTGAWADVPRGGSLNSGILRLSVGFDNTLRKTGGAGPFSGSVWTRE